MTIRLRTLLPAAVALATVALTGSAALAATPVPYPIGHDQPFIGLVNGKSADAVVTVVCPFPLTAGELGTPTSGQYVEVEPEVVGGSSVFGYTGSAADSIDALFSPTSTANQPVVIHDYFVKVPIPTTLRLPCAGSGEVVFAPAPTSPTARPYIVNVTYGNVAN